jgi:RNA polymerase sigma-70 factor, ECF subfamily
VGPRPRQLGQISRRFRPRRGGDSGGLRGRRRALARDGTPARPGAWLTITARNRAIDRLRRDRALAEKTRLLDVPEAVEDDMEETTFPDERLELIFTCCHPALGPEAQVALTLRALGGLRTEEIARALLVPEETMKRRLSRAKRKIRDVGIPFRIPADHLLPERMSAVLAVVYLIFNEGYGGRGDLAAEALRLGAALAALMPDESEVHGLHALMLLNDAPRRPDVADVSPPPRPVTSSPSSPDPAPLKPLEDRRRALPRAHGHLKQAGRFECC